jgi:hypothetical protein
MSEKGTARHSSILRLGAASLGKGKAWEKKK